MPLFGAFMAIFFLGESLQAYHIAGALAIGIGLWLSIHKIEVK